MNRFMNKDNMDINPFKPGDGQMPPLLAGRDGVKQVIKGLLGVLSEPSGVPSNIVLYGPRGNGKTVLLGWLKGYCVAVPGYTVLPISPSSSTPLKEQLMAGLGTALSQVTTEGSGSLGAMIAKLTGKRSVVQSSQAEPLDLFLIRQARQNPLILLVDEAHTMSAAWGQELLNVSQSVRQEAPFLLLLAGTPGLQEHLSSINTTFWNRAKKIPLGRLDEQATADAIVKPLQEAGVSLDPEILAQVIPESQLYPYFIQLWGEVLWNEARNANCKEINPSLLADARREFNFAKNLYYRDRYNEMIGGQLAPAALSVAKAFKDRKAITNIELGNILAGRQVGIAPPEDVLATIRELMNLGYIWQGSDTSQWQPGIPSLMTHVLTEAQELEPNNSRDFSPGM